MKYQVVWQPSAEQQLTKLWLNSRFRTQITEAVNRIDALLEENAAEAGESRSQGRRILLISPIGVVFEVIENQKKVVVGRVWTY